MLVLRAEVMRRTADDVWLLGTGDYRGYLRRSIADWRFDRVACGLRIEQAEEHSHFIAESR